jgi:SAM-dependent methyltransferase
MNNISGWLGPGSSLATFLLSEWQVRRGVQGAIAEIGVHHGKYFILLALLCQPGERAIAIDVFEDQHLNPDRSGLGDLQQFRRSCEIWLDRPDEVIVHQCDSLLLAGRDIFSPGLPQTAERREGVRIFSVDGSHTAQHTANDIQVAFDTLAPGGVVIVDDFYNPRWPGVQEGVHRVLNRRNDIAVAAYGDNKLYLVQASDHAAVYDFFSREIADLYTDTKAVEVCGRDAVYFTLKDALAAFDSKLDRCARLTSTFGQGGEGAVRLISGWAPHREAEGTWITKPKAVAAITVPRALRIFANRDACLSLTLTPFVHANRPSRRLAISTNFGAGFEQELIATTRIELPVPRQAVKKALELVFDGETPEAPAGILPGSTDTRPLSFMVRECELDLEPPD